MTVKARINQNHRARDPRLDPNSRPACAGVDPELFYPVGREATWREPHVKAAKAVCGRCPVLGLCRVWAIESRQPHGILGGQTPGERKATAAREKAEREQAERDAAQRSLLGGLLAERAGDPDALLRELATPAPIAVGDRVDTKRRKGVVVVAILPRGWFNGRTLSGQVLGMSSADVVRVRP